MKYKRNCIFCKNSKNSIVNGQFLIEELASGFLLLNPNQSYEGRCLLILKDHVENVWEVDAYNLNLLNFDLQMIAETLKITFNADLINFASLGNKVPHFHYHIIPRMRGDQNWGNPPWPNDKLTLSDDDYKKVISKIQKTLNYLYAHEN